MIKIGMIGLDTSHAISFTKLLNDPANEQHIAGGKVTVAYPGGSPDFALSIDRVAGYTRDMQEQFGVKIADTPEAVAAECDAILLESCDARVHLEQFRRIAPYGKPVFIDKPLALRGEEAVEIGRIAAEHKVPIMSSSSLRYSRTVKAAIAGEARATVLGADVQGPINIEPTQSYYFWYGIHLADTLFAIMGKGCKEVTAVSTEGHDVVTGKWSDGRIGTMRGGRGGVYPFGATIFQPERTIHCDSQGEGFPYYADMLQDVMAMFKSGKPALDWEETVEVIRFLEAAEESRRKGVTVQLD
ncbi:Gfo/Idh/MocA family protein [Paenibacillus sp. GCM10027626]|uniref:Gfo/Idh/MocA family protein n=1 Tax=Paenibacillus sp. GCM10027626 TaxID=3273411 RepID=UPI00362B8B41